MIAGSVTVRGTIRLSGPLNSSTDGGVIRVCICDVSLIDVPAVCIAELTIPVTDATLSVGAAIPFELAFSPKLGASYALEAHVSQIDAGTIAVGDLITTESYPVPTDRTETVLDVTAHPVR